ncbi:Os11g0661200, partial [Oryza sativa Japonica Group]
WRKRRENRDDLKRRENWNSRKKEKDKPWRGPQRRPEREHLLKLVQRLKGRPPSVHSALLCKGLNRKLVRGLQLRLKKKLQGLLQKQGRGLHLKPRRERGLQQKELLPREFSKKQGRELNVLQWKELLLRLGKDRQLLQQLLLEKNRAQQMILSLSLVRVPEQIVRQSRGLQQWILCLILNLNLEQPRMDHRDQPPPQHL